MEGPKLYLVFSIIRGGRKLKTADQYQYLFYITQVSFDCLHEWATWSLILVSLSDNYYGLLGGITYT